MEVIYEDVRTPIGTFRVGEGDDGTLVAAAFVDDWDDVLRRLGARGRPGATRSAHAVRAYFDGDLRALDDTPVRYEGSDFRSSVWSQLRRIPVGTTVSYSELARAVGAPRACRAVGTANGANPISVIVPCHRVVRADGTTGGYGGGPDRKAWLLHHEAGGPT